MRDLSATVGVALAPAFQVLTVAVRETASVLLPMMRQMAPILQDLAFSGLRVFRAVIEVLAAQLQAMMPLFALFGEVVAGIVPVVQSFGFILTAAWRTLADLLRSVFGGTELEAFRSAMRSLATAAAYAAVAISRWVGATGFLENLMRAVRGEATPRESAVGLAAPREGRVTGFEESIKAMTAAAFMATGEAAKEDKRAAEEKAWREQLAKTLEDIQAGLVDPEKMAVDALLRFYRDSGLEDFIGLVKQTWGQGAETYDTVKETAGHVVGSAALTHPLGAFLGGAEYAQSLGHSIGVAIGTRLRGG
jgi:hypothetical protein